MSEIFDNIYIWVFLVITESALLLALVRYMLCSHFTQNCILLYFLEAKNPYFVTKIYWKSSCICVFILSKKQRNWFHKNLHTQEWLVVESCPTPRWITFLMLYRLVYNIRSHFNELILPWSTYLEISQNSQESTSARATFLNKVAGLLKRGAGTGFFL